VSSSAQGGPPPNPLLGITFKAAGTVGFAILGAMVKALAPRYPLGEIIFFRSFFMLVPVLAVAGLGASGFAILRTKRLASHARRFVAGALGLTTTFITVLLLPYADATALTFSAPLALIVLAIPLLGETIGPYRIGATIIGFVGVLLIVEPYAAGSAGESHALLGVAIGILSAFCVALAQLSVRALREEPAPTTVFYFGLFMAGGSLLSLPFGWHGPLSGSDAVLLVLTGLIGGLAQLSMTASYRFADASTLAPYDYLQLIWAVMIGYALFGERPLPLTLLGAFIVAAAGCFIAWRERQLLRRGARIQSHSARPSI
jgi:drug/metabolite transporter (DMT)-like permease